MWHGLPSAELFRSCQLLAMCLVFILMMCHTLQVRNTCKTDVSDALQPRSMFGIQSVVY